MKDCFIVYKDKDTVVCFKPYGSTVEPNTNGLPVLTDMVAELLRQSGESDEIYMTHRLDTTTAGLCVLARNQSALKKLSAAFAESKTQKEYWAVLEKSPEEKSGSLVHYLYHDARANKSYVSAKKKSTHKEARLDYTVIDENDTGALVRIRLYTGRTHQIRAQMSFLGCPLYGDKKYGGRAKAGACSLVSCSISFPSPSDGSIKRVDLSYPDFFPFDRFKN